MKSALAEPLKLADFDFDLPENLIAQEPAAERDQSRLMILDRATGSLQHRLFSDIVDYFRPGDLLVLNDTKVFSCRLPARKPGGGKAEIFLLEEKEINLWTALVKGTGDIGKRILIGSAIEAQITGETEDGAKIVRFSGVRDIREDLPTLGRMPLPPYVKREADSRDEARYQTVYAAREGAVAAPTAGLHFTQSLLDRLVAAGVELAHITLHVGPGTFQPVRVDDIAGHRMHAERYDVPVQTAQAVMRAKAENRRVIAVGTTSVRTLETAVQSDGSIAPGPGSSRLFIRPGYQFKVVNAIITNFHLPKSTLLMLVAGFAGLDEIRAAYKTAIAEKYRFYSYGDAMFIS